MAKVNIYQDKRRANQDGSFPLKITIFIRQKGQLMIGTGISVQESEWNGQSVIQTPRKNTINSILKFRYNKIEDELFKLEMDNKLQDLSLTQIKNNLLATIGDTPPESASTLIQLAS